MNASQHLTLFNLLHDIHNAGLSQNQVRTLALLFVGPENLTAISAGLGISTAAVTEIADALEGHGLAARTRGRDRRVITLSITPAGIERLETFSRYLRPLNAPAA